MTTLHDRPLQPSAVGTSRLRVLFLMDVLDDHQERFLEAYEQIRHQVASVPGHISDQLCQSLGNSSQWLITSEWESSEPFLGWVDSRAHRELVAPMSACLSSNSSLRYVIMRETPDPLTRRPEPSGGAASHGRPAPAAEAPRTDPLPAPPLASGGIVRHGLTFTVTPGSESAVAEILANYSPPQAQVDATTRLCRTSLFMRGNRVVRAVEVTGDLSNAMRHVAAQPEIRAVEEAINPYLERARDFSSPTRYVPSSPAPRSPPCTTSRLRPCLPARPPAGVSCTPSVRAMARRRCACSLTWIRRRPGIRTSRWQAARCSCVTTCSCAWSTCAGRPGRSRPIPQWAQTRAS